MLFCLDLALLIVLYFLYCPVAEPCLREGKWMTLFYFSVHKNDNDHRQKVKELLE